MGQVRRAAAKGAKLRRVVFMLCNPTLLEMASKPEPDHYQKETNATYTAECLIMWRSCLLRLRLLALVDNDI